jgi:hypothetical protein
MTNFKDGNKNKMFDKPANRKKRPAKVKGTPAGSGTWVLDDFTIFEYDTFLQEDGNTLFIGSPVFSDKKVQIILTPRQQIKAHQLGIAKREIMAMLQEQE